MIDPIVILRDFMVKGKKVRYENSELIFGSTRIPISSPTAWRKNKQSEHYTIGALWVYLINSKEDVKNYLTDVQRYVVGVISLTDKEIIKDYFFGKSDNNECIDEEFRPSTLIAKHKKQDVLTATPGDNKHDEEAMELGSGTKEEVKLLKLTKNEQILDYLAHNEKKIITRHEQIQGRKVNTMLFIELFGNTSIGS